MPVDGGEGGNLGEPKLPGGGCVGVHPIADGFGCVGGGGGVWWMGCWAGRAKIGGGGGGSGGLRGVLTANPIGPMGLPNCSLCGNMIVVTCWITCLKSYSLSNLDVKLKNQVDAQWTTW